MRPFVCAANWKMNKSPEQAADFMRTLTAGLPPELHKEVLIFPPAICWREVRDGIRDLPIGWGLQNGHPEASGAFTGEISMRMIAGLGARTVLIGHSERRSLFFETDAFVADKFKSAQECGLVPMLCLGETLVQRDAGETDNIILKQLQDGLAKADFSKKFYVAYEPVWAIGTGKVATPEIAQAAHAALRAGLKKLAGESAGARTAILYGGSVKSDNAAELAAKEDIDGFLVGGASLNADSFLQIVEVS